MYKIEIYDENEFKNSYLELFNKIKTSFPKKNNFVFVQFLSLDGNLFEITYADKNNEDYSVLIEYDLNTKDFQIDFNED